MVTMPLRGSINLEYQVEQVPYTNAIDEWEKRFGLDPSRSVRKQIASGLGVTSSHSPLDWVFLRLREILSYPDTCQGWESPVTEAATRLLEQDSFDAMISTSPPIISHLAARRVKRRYGIPWIADFPHLWSQNNGYPFSDARRWLDRRLEIKTLAVADCLVTVAGPLAEKLSMLHGGRRVETITHGYAPETLNDLPAPLTDKFTITYTGSWHPTLRSPALFLGVLSRMLDSGKMDRSRISVRFYGEKEMWLVPIIDKLGLSDVVRQCGTVSLDESRARQRESHVLLQPKWNDPEEPGMMSSKIFEYLAACRPIMAVGAYRDVVDDVLADTGSGICASSEEEIEDALMVWYNDYESTGNVAHKGDPARILNYSQRQMAKQFAEILNSLQPNG